MKLKEEKWELIFNWLKKNKETVATMESCTGGGVASMITNLSGASEIFSMGLVTYGNDVKIKFGVPKEIIDKYTVYSKETAFSMAECVANKADATYGIGITGQLSNPTGVTYICIYDSKTKKAHYQTISVNLQKRSDEKTVVINSMIDLFFEVIGLC